MTLVGVLDRLPVPFFRTLQLTVLVALFFALANLTACALNPVAHAVTPEQKYNAALLTYDAALEVALEILEDPQAPTNLRTSVRAAVLASGEVYTSAQATFAEFKAAKAAVAAGGPGNALAVATANLEQWTANLEATIGRLDALTQRN